MISQFKTYDGVYSSDPRISIYVYKSNASGNLYWHVQADGPDYSNPPNYPWHVRWSVDNTAVPVPTGEWFKYEVFWHRVVTNYSDSRFWVAVNGQVICDYSDPVYGLMGPDHRRINRIMLSNNYSGNEGSYQWITGLEIWDGFPDVPGSAPAAPSGLTVVTNGFGRIDLAWTDNSTNETQFRIERKTDVGSYAFLTNAPAGSTSQSDTTVIGNTTYTYRVRAENSSTNSAWSNEASATPPDNGHTLYEAELLPVTGVPSATMMNFAEAGASGGTNSLLKATNVGNYITYTVNVPAAGTYDLRVRLNNYLSRGKGKLYVDGSPSAQGPEMDLYDSSGSYVYQTVDQGNITFTTAGNHTFKFQVSAVGGGGGYKLAFDYFDLVKVPTLLITAGAPDFVAASWTPPTAGFVLQVSGTLTPPAWVNAPSGATNPVTLPMTPSACFYRLSSP
jgi:hypothetical protein